MAGHSGQDHTTHYQENSLTLWGAVSMGVGRAIIISLLICVVVYLLVGELITLSHKSKTRPDAVS